MLCSIEAGYISKRDPKKGNCYIGVTQPTLKLGPTLETFFFNEKRKKDIIKLCDWKHCSSKIENLNKKEVRNFQNNDLLCNYIDFYLWVLFMIGESIFLHVQTEISDKKIKKKKKKKKTWPTMKF